MKKLSSFLLTAILLLGLLMPAVKTSAATNLITNPSLETASGSSPQAWQMGGWGTNSRSLTYETTGATGTRSVRTSISAYTSGDAKWFFNPVAVTAGKTYLFSQSYRASTTSYLVAQYGSASNTFSYQELKSVPASANTWATTTQELTIPNGAVNVSVFHLIRSVGWLQIDDASLTDKTETTPTAPQVSITTPANGVNVSNTQTVSAAANDTSGTVMGVTFRANGTQIGGEDTTAPYAVNWDTTSVTNGSYSLTATARSSSGLSATSSPVMVTIFNTQTPPPDPDPSNNIVPNPSVELVSTSNVNQPQSWLTNSWGTNAASFSYQNTGNTGNRSVRTTVTSYTSGDAKWYFSPVLVDANKQYSVSDYYQSNVPTEVIAQLTSTTGALSYVWLGTAPASPSMWTQFSGTLTTAANTARVSIFHIVNSVGWLAIDDMEVSPAAATPPPNSTPQTVPPNASFETAAAGNSQAPANWSTNKWGTNTASFQYMNEGRTGSKSARVTVSNYSSGDAKWFFDPISLSPGQLYRFSAWYKTTVQPHVVMYVQHVNGTEQYIALPKPLVSANAATTWQQYTDTFSVPTTANRVSVFMYINANGWLQTDDYAITAYTPTGFNRPLLTLTFDDGFEQNVTTALPYMNSYGIKSTQCYATQFIQQQPEQIPNILAFRDSGHEMCSHTVTHPFLTQLSAAQVTSELQNSKSYLESITGVQIRNFATPYGDYNLNVKNQIMQTYQSHRTVDAGFNSKDNLDITRLRVQNMLSTTTLGELQSWINYAKATNTWLILVYHKVDTTDVGPFDTYQSDFLQQLQMISQSGITVKTWQASLDELLPQL